MRSKTILSLLVISLWSLWAPAESEISCDPIELKEKSTGRTISLQVTCYQASKFHIFSKGCVDQKCELARRVRLLEDQNTVYETMVNTSEGNPGYKLCEKIGAKSYYVKIPLAFLAPTADGLGICMLKSDSSFVDVGTLWSWLTPPQKPIDKHQSSP